MDQFQEREHAFESNFSHNEELEFKVAARTVKIFGQWAAEKLGLQEKGADEYVMQLCEQLVAKSGHQHVVEKVQQDLEQKGIALSFRLLEKEMNRCESEARLSFQNLPSPRAKVG